MSGAPLERVVTSAIVYSIVIFLAINIGGIAGAILMSYPLYTAIYNSWLMVSRRRRPTFGVSPAPTYFLLLLPPSPILLPRFIPGMLIVAIVCVFIGWDRLNLVLNLLGAYKAQIAEYMVGLPVLSPVVGTIVGCFIALVEHGLPDVYSLPGWSRGLQDAVCRRKLEVIRQAGDIRISKPGGSLSALEGLSSFCSDDDWRVRAYAAYVLSERLSIHLHLALHNFMEDSDWRVRMTAIEGIRHAYMPHNRIWGLNHGLWSRGDIEKSTEEAKSELQKILNDENSRVVEAARKALQQILM